MERISGEEHHAARGSLQHKETANTLCDQQLQHDNNLTAGVTG